jgi:uncharacterized protein (DUF1501 family)
MQPHIRLHRRSLLQAGGVVLGGGILCHLLQSRAAAAGSGQSVPATSVIFVTLGGGRTPRVNVNAGRDHWPAVNNVLLAGGAYRMGQVIGATDAHGGEVTRSPYRPQNVLGMVYRHLGIDPAMTFDDYGGRPRYVLEEREPIVELS